MMPIGVSGMEPFQTVPRYVWMQMLTQIGTIAVVFGLIFVLIEVEERQPSLGNGWRGFLIAVGWILMSGYLGIKFLKRSSFWTMLWTQALDAKSLGEPADGKRYVGIAYSAGDWAYRNDTSWDRGYLQIKDGELRFRGFGPSFSLPLAFVRSVRVVSTRSIYTNSLPRVFIDWFPDGGVENTFSLEVRDAGTRSATIRETHALATWIQTNATDRPGGATGTSTVLPVASTQIAAETGVVGFNVLPADKRAAFAWSAVFVCGGLFVLVVLGRVAHYHSSFIAGILGGATMTVYRGVIVARVRKRSTSETQA
ncbi:MAG: hypothetical protein P4L46_26225 [Fimbriimonas sp.]|nr:hypothetical protein [Fimbriimonas sp.]